ncbi:MAG TPA: hypothetical protein VGG35_11435 [Streptosporangiaceae bacterium]
MRGPGRPAQEPPEVTWLDPLLDDGGEDDCSPPDPLEPEVPVPDELLVPDPDEPDPADPDPDEPDLREPEVLCWVPDVPEVDAEDDWACAVPGSV